uniref:Innexin n=2 Tax=Caenorhabditis japonica TaxID=281687 RepID=A0A8R1E6Q5_CAEJA
MQMGSSARALKSFAKLFLNIRGLRSAADRLLHDTTVWILIFFAILLASKPLFGSAITCQTPKDWPQSSSEYLHDICYYGARSRTGHVKRFNRGGGRGLGTVNVMTGTAEYYMWVPLITIGYLFLSTVPGFLWKFIGLGCFHGKDLETILDTFYAKRAEKDEGGGDDCFEVGDFVQAKRAKEIEHWIRAKSTSRFGKSRTLIVYIVMKWLQLALLVFQFRSLAFLFGNRNLFWGWN